MKKSIEIQSMKNERNLKFVRPRNGKPGYYISEITLNYRRVRRFAGWTKEEARVRLGELRKAARGGKDELEQTIKPQGPRDIFGDYARALLDSAEWKAKRSASRNEISLKHLNRAFKGTRLTDINPGVVRKYVSSRRDDGMSPATINREISLLKSILYCAEYDNLIPSNPIRGRRVKKLEEANSREKVILSMGLTDDDLCRLIDSAVDYLQPILELALTTGMRQGEILKAKWKDANLRLGTLRVPVENSKSKKERVVPIAPDLCGELDSLPRNGDYIFSNPDSGTRRKDVRGGFQAACEAANIKTGRGEGLVFHDLRHLAAYRLVKVTDIVTASKILGHSSLDMTLRYVHPTEQDKHLAVEKVAENLYRTRQKHVNAKNDGVEKGLEKQAQIN